jgi:hypothetical protein
LPETVRKCEQLLGSISLLLGKKKQLYGKATLRRIFAVVSDAYLQKEFNFGPLLSDITGLARAIAEFRRQAAELLRREGLDQFRHFRCPIGDPYTNVSAKVSIDSDIIQNLDGYYVCKKFVTYNEATFNATIRYDFSLTEFERENALLGTILDRIGVNVDPTIIWNAIPWSFVVDWVFGVNHWLKNFRRRNIEPRCNIHSYCYSVKIDRTIDTLMDINQGAVYAKPAVVPLAQIHETAYRRVVPDVIDLSSSFRTSGLSPKEFSLSGALIFSRGRHR